MGITYFWHWYVSQLVRNTPDDFRPQKEITDKGRLSKATETDRSHLRLPTPLIKELSQPESNLL
jgi:hypothetical protein